MNEKTFWSAIAKVIKGYQKFSSTAKSSTVPVRAPRRKVGGGWIFRDRSERGVTARRAAERTGGAVLRARIVFESRIPVSLATKHTGYVTIVVVSRTHRTA